MKVNPCMYTLLYSKILLKASLYNAVYSVRLILEDFIYISVCTYTEAFRLSFQY